MLRLLYLLAAIGASAHGVHAPGGVHDMADDDKLSYAERHMASEHHIESFDLPSFFKLHDLDMDGFWNKDEIAALYGLRHHSHQAKVAAKTSNPELEEKIIGLVLEKLDLDGDGRVSLAEFEKGGMKSLPIEGDFKDLGHHYDEESEYFLHHEELYHSTPETQTDESYTHPEDIEHFKHHAHIEEVEDAREREFEGLPANADLTEERVVHDPLDEYAHEEGDGPEAYAASGQGPDANAVPGDVTTGEGEKVEQVSSEARDAAAQARFKAERAARKQPPRRISEEHSSGHKHRLSAEDRARAGTPYKYKMRGGLLADEF